jgi:signal transduction histidine kinase
VRSIAGLHGGTVRANSGGLGKGATFTITLPLASSAGDSQRAL